MTYVVNAPEAIDPGCEKCKTWGKSLSPGHPMAVRCDCGRYTWANLGVNCPAGMDVFFGAGRESVDDYNRTRVR